MCIFSKTNFDFFLNRKMLVLALVNNYISNHSKLRVVQGSIGFVDLKGEILHIQRKSYAVTDWDLVYFIFVCDSKVG